MARLAENHRFHRFRVVENFNRLASLAPGRVDLGVGKAPLTCSLNDLIKTGKYNQVLEKWNLDSERIEKAAINPPGLPKS